jgi:anti-sigma factor RsiW
MLPTPPTSDCDRAREAASAALDGELSELEDAFLVVHRATCPACDAFATGLAGVVEALQAAPLALPSQPIEVRRPPRLQRTRAAGAAALVAAAALAATIVAANRLDPSEPLAGPVPSSTQAADVHYSLLNPAPTPEGPGTQEADAHYSLLNPTPARPPGPRQRVGANVPV